LVYKILYKASVERDLKKLDKTLTSKLLAKLEKQLGQDPNLGEPLKGEFQGLFKYTVGDHRVIYAKTSDGVLVLRIAHRREAYR
jgi:addiction module RelE/StbE family toxin